LRREPGDSGIEVVSAATMPPVSSKLDNLSEIAARIIAPASHRTG
jgi:hypothetical protein